MRCIVKDIFNILEERFAHVIKLNSLVLNEGNVDRKQARHYRSNVSQLKQPNHVYQTTLLYVLVRQKKNSISTNRLQNDHKNETVTSKMTNRACTISS